MNMDCDIIRDLLPLYAENMTSEKSNHAVKEHLAACTACRQYLHELKDEATAFPAFAQSIKPLKKIQIKLLLIAVLLMTVVSILWGLVLMQPGDEMAYSLLVFYLLIPLTSCIVCGILTGKTRIIRWLAPFCFAAINTVLPLLVFGTAEFILTALAFACGIVGMLGAFIILFVKSKIKE
ncbi:MAG: zf-HC2 domain-containing protein [Clostridia bacterium]|nr:zf-HC2 domain-containing protein [Clostridia bacterium]